MSSTPPPSAANALTRTPFDALRTAGLLSDDPAAAAAFDLAGFKESPSQWASAARKARPELFFDAMTATDVERKAWLRKQEQADFDARCQRLDARAMADHQARHGAR